MSVPFARIEADFVPPVDDLGQSQTGLNGFLDLVQC
jgi:hypothetical protein